MTDVTYSPEAERRWFERHDSKYGTLEPRIQCRTLDLRHDPDQHQFAVDWLDQYKFAGDILEIVAREYPNPSKIGELVTALCMTEWRRVAALQIEKMDELCHTLKS